MNNKLINGDCLEELKKLDDNSVDLLCTDPPYGYGFMGKHWDTFKEKDSTKSQQVGWMSPGMKKDTYGMKEFFDPIWTECLRVLKPGALAFVMSAPRSDVQSIMAQTLQEAGFDISFTPIYWTYASGFPKAMNVSKMLEKNGNQKEELDGSYGGFQPKPAVEVVLVAMKPIEEKGLLAQAQKNGKAVSWFDDCRIPFEEGHEPSDNQSMPDLRDVGKKSKEAIGIDKLSYGQVENAERLEYEPNTVGRFPANLLVSDNIIDDGKITKSTGGRSGNKKGIGTYGIYGKFESDVRNEDPGFGDSGGYSRYFSLDAWWSKNLKSLPEPVQQTFPFMIVPKASKSEKNNGLDNFEVKQRKGGGGTSNDTWYEDDVNSASGKFGSEKAPSRNIHPTVKPLTLMSYLVTLGSRKGDMVLDPFMGSGTTPLACVSLERKYIGIDNEEEYYEIAKARVKKLEAPIKVWEKFI